MFILAKTIKGREFMYKPETARKVSAASADRILNIVNEHKFLLDVDAGETWYKYEIDKYDIAAIYAERQAFTIRNGIVTARAY